MEPELPIPNIITDNGWLFKSACQCSGNLKYKFSHPSYEGMELKLYVKRGKIIIMNYGLTLLPSTKLNSLDNVMKLLAG